MGMRWPPALLGSVHVCIWPGLALLPPPQPRPSQWGRQKGYPLGLEAEQRAVLAMKAQQCVSVPSLHCFMLGCKQHFVFIACNCNPDGSALGLEGCDPGTGQCHCLPHVLGRTCELCQHGYYGLQAAVGCKR